MFSFVDGANKSVDMDDREGNVASCDPVNGSDSSSGVPQVAGRSVADVEIVPCKIRNLPQSVMLFVIALVGVAVLTCIAASYVTSRVAMIAFSLGLAVVIGAGIWFFLKGEERYVAKVLRKSQAEDPVQIAEELIAEPTWTRRLYVALLRDELARRGCWGTTLRLWRWEHPEAIRPFEITFEPRLLDEAEPSLRELMRISNDTSGAAGRDEGRRTSTEFAFGRRLRRNVMMSGGWLAIIAIVPMFLHALKESVNSGTVTTRTLLLGALIFTSLIMPRACCRAWLRAKELLIVPGGLLLRQSKRRGLASELHLFRRETSILCVSTEKERVWKILISDADRRETFHITEDEVNVALRAWLSPIEPPPVERLSDFV